MLLIVKKCLFSPALMIKSSTKSFLLVACGDLLTSFIIIRALFCAFFSIFCISTGIDVNTT